jgi:F-type H+-transporting ATPase subunit gamma
MELFHAVTSSKASEHTMRMLAMNQATENSEELLQSLQLKYNKIRQENITKDILDIMGGSEVHSDE